MTGQGERGVSDSRRAGAAVVFNSLSCWEGPRLMTVRWSWGPKDLSRSRWGGVDITSDRLHGAGVTAAVLEHSSGFMMSCEACLGGRRIKAETLPLTSSAPNEKRTSKQEWGLMICCAGQHGRALLRTLQHSLPWGLSISHTSRTPSFHEDRALVFSCVRLFTYCSTCLLDRSAIPGPALQSCQLSRHA
jgi:hypothetical protein